MAAADTARDGEDRRGFPLRPPEAGIASPWIPTETGAYFPRELGFQTGRLASPGFLPRDWVGILAGKGVPKRGLSLA